MRHFRTPCRFAAPPHPPPLPLLVWLVSCGDVALQVYHTRAFVNPIYGATSMCLGADISVLRVKLGTVLTPDEMHTLFYPGWDA